MLIKTIVFLLFIVSTNTFACSVQGEMALSRLFQRGISNKLASMPVYKNYEIKTITKVSFPSTFDVLIQDEASNKCLKLVMNSYGTGSCKFTADIVSETSLNCP